MFCLHLDLKSENVAWGQKRLIILCNVNTNKNKTKNIIGNNGVFMYLIMLSYVIFLFSNSGRVCVL